MKWKASSAFDSETAGDRAFDGRLDTKWCAAWTEGGPWLALDLGGEKEITGVVLKSASMAGESAGFDTGAFAVESGESLDGPWATLREVDAMTSPTHPQFGRAYAAVRFDPPPHARFVRLRVANPCPLDNIARIVEFEVYGRDTP